MAGSQIQALPLNLGAPVPFVNAINDRLRRISMALDAASATTAGSSDLVVYGTHAARVNKPVPADGTLYVETDRGVVYQVRGTAFVWLSGTMTAAWAKLPGDLGAADAGFTFVDSGSLHVWLWSGTAWGWGPGNRASGEMAEFDADPGVGWHLCDGTGSLTKYAANATRSTTFAVPDRRGFYTVGGAYTGTGVAAAPATTAGSAVTLTVTTGTVLAGVGVSDTFVTGVSVASVTQPTITAGAPPVATFATLYYYRL